MRKELTAVSGNTECFLCCLLQEKAAKTSILTLFFFLDKTLFLQWKRQAECFDCSIDCVNDLIHQCCWNNLGDLGKSLNGIWSMAA